MSRALIIGHTGQDGSILWDQLVARDFSLIGISRHASRAHREQWISAADMTDPAFVRRLMDYFRPNHLYFLAAYHHSSQEQRDDEVSVWHDSWAVNVQAFLYFLDAVKLISPHTRVFYASSSRVFGDATISPQNERTPLAPVCIYGVTKTSAMHLADYYRRVYGIFVSCGILFNHESPLRGAQYVTQRVVDGLVALKYGHVASLEIGSLDARVDWGYAPDFTNAMRLILEADVAEDFVVATGETHSVRDLITIGADYLGLASDVPVIETAGILRRKPQYLCGDYSRLQRVTGWKPEVGFRDMVHILVDGALSRYQTSPRS